MRTPRGHIRQRGGSFEISVAGLRELEIRVDILDVLYAELRRCRKLCGGEQGLVYHRPPGSGEAARRGWARA